MQQLMSQVPGMVVINRIIPGFEHRCIALDNQYGSWLGTRYLIQQGHQKIAWICSSHPIADAAERTQGYRQALAEHQLPAPASLMAWGEPDEAGGEQAMVSLLAQGQSFSAVACYNDSMAAGALAALNDNGLQVPQQISLIGFDDVLVSRYIRPGLTTVRYPVVAMAKQATRLALALSQAEPPTEVTHLFQPTLVIRHSVNPAEDR